MLKFLWERKWWVIVFAVLAFAVSGMTARYVGFERDENRVRGFLEQQNFEVVHVTHFVNYTSVFCTRFDKSYPFVVRHPKGEYRGVVCISKETDAPRFGILAHTTTMDVPLVDLRN